MDVYRGYAERLIKERKAYYCFCTAEELERDRQQAMAEQRQPNYSGKCRNIDPAKRSGVYLRESRRQYACRFRSAPSASMTLCAATWNFE